MIVFHLAEVLEDKDVSQRQLYKATKIRPGTICAYCHGYAKRVNVDDLNKICEFLECSLSDIIEYISISDKK